MHLRTQGSARPSVQGNPRRCPLHRNNLLTQNLARTPGTANEGVGCRREPRLLFRARSCHICLQVEPGLDCHRHSCLLHQREWKQNSVPNNLRLPGMFAAGRNVVRPVVLAGSTSEPAHASRTRLSKVLSRAPPCCIIMRKWLLMRASDMMAAEEEFYDEK